MGWEASGWRSRGEQSIVDRHRSVASSVHRETLHLISDEQIGPSHQHHSHSAGQRPATGRSTRPSVWFLVSIYWKSSFPSGRNRLQPLKKSKSPLQETVRHPLRAVDRQAGYRRGSVNGRHPALTAGTNGKTTRLQISFVEEMQQI